MIPCVLFSRSRKISTRIKVSHGRIRYKQVSKVIVAKCLRIEGNYDANKTKARKRRMSYRQTVKIGENSAADSPDGKTVANICLNHQTYQQSVSSVIGPTKQS